VNIGCVGDQIEAGVAGAAIPDIAVLAPFESLKTHVSHVGCSGAGTVDAEPLVDTHGVELGLGSRRPDADVAAVVHEHRAGG